MMSPTEIASDLAHACGLSHACALGEISQRIKSVANGGFSVTFSSAGYAKKTVVNGDSLQAFMFPRHPRLIAWAIISEIGSNAFLR